MWDVSHDGSSSNSSTHSAAERKARERERKLVQCCCCCHTICCVCTLQPIKLPGIRDWTSCALQKHSRERKKGKMVVLCNMYNLKKKSFSLSAAAGAVLIFLRVHIVPGKMVRGGTTPSKKKREKTPSSDEMKNLIDLLYIRVSGASFFRHMGGGGRMLYKPSHLFVLAGNYMTRIFFSAPGIVFICDVCVEMKINIGNPRLSSNSAVYIESDHVGRQRFLFGLVTIFFPRIFITLERNSMDRIDLLMAFTTRNYYTRKILMWKIGRIFRWLLGGIRIAYLAYLYCFRCSAYFFFRTPSRRGR